MILTRSTACIRLAIQYANKLNSKLTPSAGRVLNFSHTIQLMGLTHSPFPAIGMFHQKPPLKSKTLLLPEIKSKPKMKFCLNFFFREQSRIKFVPIGHPPMVRRIVAKTQFERSFPFFFGRYQA